MLKRWMGSLGVLLCVASCTSRGASRADAGSLADAGGDAGPLCLHSFEGDAAAAPAARGLRFSELLSSNEGVNVDERGETDDWLELINEGASPLALSDYALGDARGKLHRLPAMTLAPGELLLLWADDDQAQGARHLSLKLSAKGEPLTLWRDGCTPVDRVVLPALADNESYARLAGADPFVSCRYATPGRANGVRCAPPAPPALPPERTYRPHTWPIGWPVAPSPLSISELSLRPAAFIEVLNTSSQSVPLGDYALRLAPVLPSAPYPTFERSAQPAWPVATLAPGQRVVVPLVAADTAALEAQPDFEGAALLIGPSEALIDRVEFSHWPQGAVIARAPDGNGQPTLCTDATPGEPNQCTPLPPGRPVGDRLHALHSASDFGALSLGGTESGQLSVKFVVDMEARDSVHLLGTGRWALHYTFARERIFLEPALNRCDAVQATAFDRGWRAFSDREYFSLPGRRFLLGTLVRWANGLQTVEFAAGDVISAPLVQRAFLAVLSRLPDPRAWSLRPSNVEQSELMLALDGSLPIVDRDAPFRDLTYQALTRAEGFGYLRFVSGSELATAPLGPDTIVVTDDVPNDVPLLGGLITEAFQAPLAHVNVLSEARGTPNMGLRDARNHPRVAPLLGKLVRLEVGAQDFSVREASAEEADAFWQSRRPTGPRLLPPSDLRERALLSLPGRSLADLPTIGAKAAQFAELYRIRESDPRCPGPLTFSVPPRAFAVPLVHYDEHFSASGARALLIAQLSDPLFRADPAARAIGLAAVRSAIMGHPVDPGLLSQVTAMVRERFGEQRVRLRSSSNSEDMPTFNGAGLHTSISAELGDSERNLDDALRTVWASLWNLRAYDERENANIEQLGARMGVLVHEQYGGEAAQGVGISRNLLDVTSDDSYYINAQIGEANVTNPAPGVITEQLLYSLPPGWYATRYQTRSSLTGGAAVLSPAELDRVGCALAAVHRHYRPLLDPGDENRLFAMQIEFKLDARRELVVKQARPQPFGYVALPSDCR